MCSREPSIPADKVSFSMGFTYRGRDRTLTGEEVNAHPPGIRRTTGGASCI